jgi:hypothetical protein
MTLGAEINTFSCFTGKLDQISLYGIALNDTEIEALDSGMGFTTIEVGSFTPTEGTSNKFTYLWSDIQGFTQGNYTTGDFMDIIIELTDIDSGTSRNITYTALLDFEAPTIAISLGDGQTDYSSATHAAPWTPYEVEFSDNVQSVVSHAEYYYDELMEYAYRITIYDNATDTVVYASSFASLTENATLFDLGIPHGLFTNVSEYYYVIEFQATDTAGNVACASDYYNDVSKIIVSHEVSITFQNGMDSIDINDLYNGISQMLNFTLTGPDGSELKNKDIDLKALEYYFTSVIWNETSQSYQMILHDLMDAIVYSKSMFTTEFYANYPIDNKLTSLSIGDDHYVFIKNISLETPFVLK